MIDLLLNSTKLDITKNEGLTFFKDVNKILDEWKSSNKITERDYEYMFLMNCKLLIENQVRTRLNKNIDVYFNKLDTFLSRIND